MPSKVALAAEPLNQPSQVAKITVKMTLDTYSGVAVEAIEATDNALSVRDPSRMPASTPMSSETGTITASTQNIRMPVAPSAGNSLAETVERNLVEQPKSPCSTPENFGSSDASQELKRGAGAPLPLTAG